MTLLMRLIPVRLRRLNRLLDAPTMNKRTYRRRQTSKPESLKRRGALFGMSLASMDSYLSKVPSRVPMTSSLDQQTPSCPSCGEPMALLMNRTGGMSFCGCRRRHLLLNQVDDLLPMLWTQAVASPVIGILAEVGHEPRWKGGQRWHAMSP